MTNQEAFTKIVTHLREQGKPCMDDTNKCLYHGPEGMKCAIGALIPDSEYKPEFESMSLFDIVEISSLKELDPFFLEELQSIHDRSSRAINYMGEVEKRIYDTAVAFSLTIPFLEVTQ